jgi:N-acetyl-gamma-glutamyl-phosphate reductase
MKNKIKVAVLGANGYTGFELVKILSRHPRVELKYLVSRSSAGEEVAALYPSLFGLKDKFCGMDAGKIAAECDAVFSCLPHASASETVAALIGLDPALKIIDLSADFRYTDLAVYENTYKVKHAAPDLLRKAVYGLCELYREKIKGAAVVGNPGCYTTCAILALYPLLKEKAVEPARIIIDAKSGVTGAGRRAEIGYSFCETSDNFKTYSVAAHRHTSEIEEKLSEGAGDKITVTFTPHLLPVNRGILSTIYAAAKVSEREIAEIYAKYYGKEPFIGILSAGTMPELKHVARSNNFMAGYKLDARTGNLIVVGVLDNLVKGASGQAVQNMNLMFGFEETEGLMFPASYL